MRVPRFPGVALGSLMLAGAAPQANEIRGFTANGKMQDREWNYEIAATYMDNLESMASRLGVSQGCLI